jgi:acetyl-CoA carboxylase carboxyltransferase component
VVQEAQPGPLPVVSPMQGVVVALPREVGAAVREGATLVVLESMKMEFPVAAPTAGTVAAVRVAVGDQVQAGDLLAQVAPGEPAQPDSGAGGGPEGVRPDLEELRARTALLRDQGRGDAVAKRHAAGRRTVREDLSDLLDDGSWVEYGALAIAAQRARRSEQDLIARTPADGLIAGLGTVNAELVGADRARCAVLAYDYTVLAGTQGTVGHVKTDRFLEVVERLRVPVVLLAEGGGGRPGDTDHHVLTGLHTTSFSLWAGLSGLVPRIGVVSGNCFAGNAALLGCADVVIATRNSSIGMGGPAMIEGGGLGRYRPEEVGPTAVQAANGVLDVVVDDDAAAMATARQALSYFQGTVPAGEAPDQDLLRTVLPAERARAYDVRAVVDLLADAGSVLELRAAFAPGMVTALVRLAGRPVGVLANDPRHVAGAITSDGADKAARFLQLCDAFDLPVLSLVDTPGIMVGPEAEATGLVRHSARLFTVAASLTVPVVAVVLRRAYGLGAQAMMAGSTRAPLLTVAWPSGELGPMGVEGAVRLGMSKELAAVTDDDERRRLTEELIAAQHARGRALPVATAFEIDDVIDPADTRDIVLQVLRSAGAPAPRTDRKRVIDTW